MTEALANLFIAIFIALWPGRIWMIYAPPARSAAGVPMRCIRSHALPTSLTRNFAVSMLFFIVSLAVIGTHEARRAGATLVFPEAGLRSYSMTIILASMSCEGSFRCEAFVTRIAPVAFLWLLRQALRC